MIDILESDRCERFGANGHRKALDQFSIESTVDSYQSVYQNIVDYEAGTGRSTRERILSLGRNLLNR